MLALELRFVGSLVALEEFARGGADAAGFHVPAGTRMRDDAAAYLRFLSPRRDRLIRFVEREQGLILPRGNPARVRNFRDVAERGLRFVNRQRGSGTRLLIERHLDDEGVAPASLAGYANEEYTHAAVAATVASGGAEAGFGLRAAAAEYRLAFVPLVRERYFIAVRTADIATPAVVALSTRYAARTRRASSPDCRDIAWHPRGRSSTSKPSRGRGAVDRRGGLRGVARDSSHWQ